MGGHAQRTGAVEAALRDGRSWRGAQRPGRIRADRSEQRRGRGDARSEHEGVRVWSDGRPTTSIIEFLLVISLLIWLFPYVIPLKALQDNVSC